MSYQHLYQRFLNANPDTLHFACHSHYYWPDVTRQAMLDYWDDSARHVDEKWQFFFEQKIPALQSHIAKVLNTGRPQQLAFAPNTHELLFRIISTLDVGERPLRVLTSDSEFHSFQRQIARLEEAGRVEVQRINSLPIDDFSERFTEAAASEEFDLIFVSQVFFNSGLVFDGIEPLVEQIRDSDTVVVIDGYHAFMAIPTDLADVADRIFYLAGGYKYAQGGEGGCFVHVPDYQDWRPVYTGWYAEFGALQEARGEQVNYARNGMCMAGATMDFSPLYRMLSVMELFADEGITVEEINNYIGNLQRAFLVQLDQYQHPLLNRHRLLAATSGKHGHFLTFQLDSPEQTAALASYLRKHGVVTDFRGSRIRFGFALYHNASQYQFRCLENHHG